MRLARKVSTFALGAAAAVVLVAAPQAGDQGMLGFEADNARQERELEARLDAQLDPNNLDQWMKRLSAQPHHVGSAYDKENAEFIAAQFRSWGYDTQIESFDVLFPTPVTRLVEMTEPQKFTATLQEPALKEDATSGQVKEQLPTYNAYSPDGDVTGELVYVNRGVPDDYKELDRLGIDVKGKIVIARYGGSWRGIKPKVAAEHGAIGCILYSDPRDDGYFQGETYPQGAFRNENGVQRGSVADMPVFSGDPLTPFIGATKDAKRLELSQATTIAKIPTLPISHHDAMPLLHALTGPIAPEKWRGALPITYRVGPGAANVHLKLKFDWSLKPVYDVIARLPGSERPDQWIMRGNHHDGWVNGASDPISGQVAMMEEARAIGELAKTGWKPKRTIIYMAWDGEEPGLLGSTEWVETHMDELKAHGAVYINTDSNGRGFFGAGGSHTLERLVNEVSGDVTDPQKNISVGQRARAKEIADAEKPEDRKEARERADLRIEALGSGSDFTPFLQHAGVASLNLGYGGEDDGGSYHSIYDSYDHYKRFGDPKFAYGVTMAKTGGRVVLRLANADVLPLELTDFADTLAKFVKEVTKLADDERDKIVEGNRGIQDGTLAAVFDPTKPYVVPTPEAAAPFLNFAPLENGLAKVQASVTNFETARKARAAGTPLTVDQSKALDAVFVGLERTLTQSAGLPRRPWFVHQIYAPGYYTGYGVKTLPGIREAIEQHHWSEAEEQVGVVAKTLEAFAAEVDKATAIVAPPASTSATSSDR